MQGTDLNQDPCPSAELPHWIELAELPGIGRATALALVRALGSPAAVLSADPAGLRGIVPSRVVQALIDRSSLAQSLAAKVAATMDWLSLPHRHLLPITHPAYPDLLRQIPDPPLMLYCHGELAMLARPMIAIVGSRNASAQGRLNAEAFATALSAAGLAIISGMALGIDACAHLGGLAQRGSTVAVLGTGVDVVYPRQHRALSERISDQGCLVSEYALGTPVLPANFPQRNRIISGLAHAVLVVEAAAKSGSLITARMALEQGRDVFAIPGSIHSSLSKGCHSLIKQGAALVETADDVLGQMGISTHVAPSPTRCGDMPAHGDAADPHRPLLLALGHDPVDVDSLAIRLNAAPGPLSAQLLALELAGQVERLPGGLVQRIFLDT